MELLLLILLILGVLALGAVAFRERHLGWAGLFLIFLAELIRAWPKA